MAHPQQQQFLQSVRDKYPEKFKNCRVLDVGSLDINGNNRYLFSGNYNYTGIDIGPGKNVDIVSRGHEFKDELGFDIVVSSECFEHDEFWQLTIQNCINLTKKGGIFLFTCATEGRQEHGTKRTTPQDSPFTSLLENDYYRNITQRDVEEAIPLSNYFELYTFSIHLGTKDLYFYGIKK